MTKCPYSFPARSRKAMTAYLLDRKGYCDHYTPFPFSWNVKAYGVDCEHPKGEKHNPAFDAAWAKHIGDNSDLYNLAVEDAQRHYADKEWTSWPGDDQGDWQFGFYGRSGGHICLETWCDLKMYGRDFDLAEYLAGIDMQALRTLYRAVVCMDRDFTRAAAAENIEFQLSFQRMLWEEEQGAELESAATELEESRPDMYEIR